MYFIDEVTGLEAQHPRPRRVLVSIVDGMYIFGYTHPEHSTLRVQDPRIGEVVEVLENGPFLQTELIYSNRNGCYMFKNGMSPREIIHETMIKGRGGFPYTFQRHYEAIESFKIFKGKQKRVDTTKKYPLSDYMKYTFGLEFETSEGYIPEHICYRDGLIPLRDGSISGLEYSTVVLSGEEGLGLLDQQLKTLRTYTDFDKECSLHIHFGDFPVNTVAIFNLYKLCRHLEGEIQQLVPELTFNSASYKKNGKDYCKVLPGRDDRGRAFRTFEELYEALVGKSYEGSLSQPHPSDPNRDRKWNITTRYFWVNFINILCYNVNKTIEFRLLRPSFNLEKINLWMYIFNAILMYAEKAPANQDFSDVSLNYIFNEIYPEELVNFLNDECYKLRLLIQKQTRYGDQIGSTIQFENEMFCPEKAI